MMLRQLDRAMRDRDAEIGDLHRAVIFHQHVLRLDVPVDVCFSWAMATALVSCSMMSTRLIQVQCAALGDQRLSVRPRTYSMTI